LIADIVVGVLILLLLLLLDVVVVGDGWIVGVDMHFGEDVAVVWGVGGLLRLGVWESLIRGAVHKTIFIII
jgi:hypothetical protein